ncbi:FO synthase subunit 1 [Durusdinium trenchii]|uniref:FO synthase subunit 1 n=1 Tax=Durusdinium trenchii TaxID=1381693 RepID=A0ABP0QFV1_9DINO
MPAKRKSKGGDGSEPDPKKLARRLAPELAEKYPYVPKLVDCDAHTSTARAVAAALRLTQKVLPEGGSDSYLAKTYDSQDRMLWSLFLSDANVPGVEKVSVCQVPAEFLTSKWCELASLDGHLLPPFSIGYVKGWKRSVMLLVCLHGIRELAFEGELGHALKASYGTIHAAFGSFRDVRSQVYANRGWAMFFRAVLTSKILQAFKFAQEWEASTSVARAFKIGKGEAAAVSNLMCKIPTEAVVFLEASVKCRGMLRYLSHDILGRDLLNAGFSSGLNGLEHWKEDLRNTTEVVPCTE